KRNFAPNSRTQRKEKSNSSETLPTQPVIRSAASPREASIVTSLAAVRRASLGNGEQGGKRPSKALERGFVWQGDSESRAALLVALQTLVETSFELACLLLCTVRWLTLRDHFAEECECGSDELASSLRHTRATSEPLCLLLLALFFRLVYR